MKYAKPGKFKSAVKELIAYIDASNGIDDLEEWREEIDNIKLGVDPKDWLLFDKVAEKLEPMGLIVAEAYKYMDSTLNDFQSLSDRLVKGIKK